MISKFYKVRKKHIWKMVRTFAFIAILLVVVAPLVGAVMFNITGMHLFLSFANTTITGSDIKVVVVLMIAYWYGAYEEWKRRKGSSTSKKLFRKKLSKRLVKV